MGGTFEHQRCECERHRCKAELGGSRNFKKKMDAIWCILGLFVAFTILVFFKANKKKLKKSRRL